jgi:predicted RNase H-like nuclease (RuvC/YqgF family)
MLLVGRLRRMSVWLWRTAPARRLLVIVRPERPGLVPRIEGLFADEPGTVDVLLDRRRRERRRAVAVHRPERRRRERRQRGTARRSGDVSVVIRRESAPGLDYTPLNRTKGEVRMMSVESKQTHDGDEVRRWLEAGQTQLASLLELLHEHDRLRERVESSERENERLRGVTYENEQLRNRLETSERQADHLRQAMGELRAENERHQKEREEAAERLNHLVNEIAQRLRPGTGAPRF